MYSVRRVPATAAPRGFSGEVESRFVGRAALSRGKAATASELGEEGERASERASEPPSLPSFLCFALPFLAPLLVIARSGREGHDRVVVAVVVLAAAAARDGL